MNCHQTTTQYSYPLLPLKLKSKQLYLPTFSKEKGKDWTRDMDMLQDIVDHVKGFCDFAAANAAETDVMYQISLVPAKKDMTSSLWTFEAGGQHTLFTIPYPPG